MNRDQIGDLGRPAPILDTQAANADDQPEPIGGRPTHSITRTMDGCVVDLVNEGSPGGAPPRNRQAHAQNTRSD